MEKDAMKMLIKHARESRNPQLAATLQRALNNGRVKFARNVFNGKRQKIQEWIGIDRRNGILPCFDPRKFALWLGRQARREFDGCDFVVALLGERPGWNARVIGVYENKTPGNPKKNPEKFRDAVKRGGLAVCLNKRTPPDVKRDSWLYKFKEMPEFVKFRLENRAFIKWLNPNKKAGRWPYQCALTRPKKIISGGDIAGR